MKKNFNFKDAYAVKIKQYTKYSEGAQIDNIFLDYNSAYEFIKTYYPNVVYYQLEVNDTIIDWWINKISNNVYLFIEIKPVRLYN